jgi:hypothetical protein
VRAHDCTLSDVRGERASLKSGIVLMAGVASCVAVNDDPEVGHAMKGRSNCEAFRLRVPIADALSKGLRSNLQSASVGVVKRACGGAVFFRFALWGGPKSDGWKRKAEAGRCNMIT